MSDLRKEVDSLEREGAYIGSWSLVNVFKPFQNQEGQYGSFLPSVIHLVD